MYSNILTIVYCIVRFSSKRCCLGIFFMEKKNKGKSFNRTRVLFTHSTCIINQILFLHIRFSFYVTWWSLYCVLSNAEDIIQKRTLLNEAIKNRKYMWDFVLIPITSRLSEMNTTIDILGHNSVSMLSVKIHEKS